MEPGAGELFTCKDCSKKFAMRMDYNRHRKQHDRPHFCSLCSRAFGLKTDLDRHRQNHQRRSSRPRFKCKFPGCRVSTLGKEYLWKHLKKKHERDTTTSKPLRAFYEDFIANVQSSQNELDLQLLEASSEGDTEKVRDLLSRGASVLTETRDSQTPFDPAINKDHRAIFEPLFNSGAPIGAKLLKAVHKENQAFVTMMIESGADINKPGQLQRHSDQNTPLYWAVRNGSKGMISHLLALGADVNAPQPYSLWTALHWAVTKSPEIARILLKANADVNAKDWKGFTPLSHAVGLSFWGPFHETNTSLLLEAGATVEQVHWDAMPIWFQKQYEKYAPSLPSPPSLSGCL
ncbi:ankyrin [Hyaloscypha variabilis F]|uniref:Ankyrin n=1 Tax=Hyaloscypha variabilis (strain UAMH 11265 / GT02V1 / F) TaxID=1149755 RepID=A0A2J6RTR9_HYAVF|nr:ankyrin [Hyaloscypha variabilis F]